MKPLEHAQRSVGRYGGKWEDYIHIHNFFDQTKAHMPDIRHRALLHNSFGIYLCEQQFGVSLTNSDGKLVSVRSIGEDHILEDLGCIPTVEQWLSKIDIMEVRNIARPTSNRARVEIIAD